MIKVYANFKDKETNNIVEQQIANYSEDVWRFVKGWHKNLRVELV